MSHSPTNLKEALPLKLQSSNSNAIISAFALLSCEGGSALSLINRLRSHQDAQEPHCDRFEESLITALT